MHNGAATLRMPTPAATPAAAPAEVVGQTEQVGTQRGRVSPGALPKVVIASHFNGDKALFNGLCFEACRVLAEVSGGQILAPGAQRPTYLRRARSVVQRAVTGFVPSSLTPARLDEDCDLFFYVAMRPDHLAPLTTIDGWRQRAGIKAAFLFETWINQARPNRQYLSLLDDFDHVFLFNPASVAAVQRYTTTPCTYLPAAIDVLSATPFTPAGPAPRAIDVYGMGRMKEEVHEQLLDMTAKSDFLYVWDRGPSVASLGFEQARFRTYHMIRRSRMFLSFGFTSVPKNTGELGREDAIPARVFEGAAGGAAMIGSVPEVPEYDDLFDWEDATLIIPEAPIDMRAFLADTDPERIRRAGVRNAVRSLEKHDWVHRWEAALQTLGLPSTADAADRKDRLQSAANAARAAFL